MSLLPNLEKLPCDFKDLKACVLKEAMTNASYFPRKIIHSHDSIKR